MLRRIMFGALLIGASAFAQEGFAAAPYLGVPPQGNAAKGASLSASCAPCHGADGNSTGPTFPNLAGQNYNYLLKQLEDFRSGARKATPMMAMIATVPKKADDENLKDLAAYFAAQKLDRTKGANATEAKPTKALAKAGYQIYAGGDPSANVPACAACHAASGLGNAPMALPALAGQQPTYVETELGRFADGKRNNAPGHIMQMITRRLTAKQIKAVAAYVQALHPDLTPGVGPKTYAAYAKAASEEAVPGIPASGLSTAQPAHSGAKKQN